MGNKIELWALRHAQSVANVEKVAASISEGKWDNLSDWGKEETKKLVELLKDEEFDLILISPLKRTQQTLQYYLDTLDKPNIEVSDMVIERDLGDLIGKPQAEINQHLEENNVNDQVGWLPPNGESLEQVCERVRKFLVWLKETHKGKKILLCTHRGVMQCLDIIFSKGDIKKYYEYETPKNMEIKKYEL